MPIIHVAFCLEDDETIERRELPRVLAEQSATNLKKKLRVKPSTRWTIAKYKIKADKATLCQIINDLSEVEAESAENYRCNAHGQLRKED